MHKWMNDRNSNGQKSYFFAHTISAEDNLTKLLREKGYTVEAVPQTTISQTVSKSSRGNKMEDEDDKQDYDEPQNEETHNEEPSTKEDTFGELLKLIGKIGSFW
ncbi:hypothetical protein niasHT_012197 [Heterodera trifolii]|uniref:Uncharacterized protein n=1 Tax=Heterodera trifolii TaxID=157864 RepID=A0ABD2KU76_9BILA